MKRRKIVLAMAGVLLLIAWGLHRTGWFSADREARDRPTPILSVDPMDTSAGWRYRQNLPRHWRYIVLQN